ncbi:MAG: UDP-N-acetylmuramoyl-tripeptide--D-alanyl-D-alanine ligase [Deltaproteobacteria bacterium]|nr:UDP-N-acetylmuramoyl-tripeptide--D-alanyl-D-alanine ligase [Deltaproteobacteria bacterium]
MHHRLRDIPALLRTPLGRLEARCAVAYRLGLRLDGVARLYRTTLLRSTRLIAVVGSFGKTTTTRAVMSALGTVAPEDVPRNSGGWLPLKILSVRPGRRYAILEAGIGHRGEMARYARTLRPDIAVVTAVGSEHNRSLGGLDAIREEKADMVRALPPAGWAVLNGDDPNVHWMAGQTRARVVTFGFNEGNDLRATELKLDWPNGSRFKLHTTGGVEAVRVRLIGQPMIYPVLAAAAVAVIENVRLDEALHALEALEPTPGRLQPVVLPNGAMLLRDDFKSPEETIEAALEVLAQIPARRRVVVLGDVSESIGKPREVCRRVGEKLAAVATQAVFLAGQNSRSYRAGAKRGGLSAEALIDAGRSVLKAIEALPSDLGPGDVVLIKGRDTQRLERLSLALMGRSVRCHLKQCTVLATTTRCDQCPMLERGWDGLRVVL